MARQIIVLDASLDDTGKTLTLTYVCWLIAPATRVNPNPNASSSVPPSTTVPWGITSAELTALQAGTTLERQASSLFDASAGIPSVATLEAALASKYSALQTALNNHAAATTAHFVGAFFDGTTWTAGP